MFEKAHALGIFRELEVVRTLVAGECQQYHPLAFVGQERRHTVFAHVWGNSKCIEIVGFEEGAGIHLRGVANVAALGIGNDKLFGIVLVEIGHRTFEGQQSLYTQRFVKGKVGLIGHAIGRSGIDNGLVKLEDGVVCLQQVLRYFLDVGV